MIHLYIFLFFHNEFIPRLESNDPYEPINKKTIGPWQYTFSPQETNNSYLLSSNHRIVIIIRLGFFKWKRVKPLSVDSPPTNTLFFLSLALFLPYAIDINVS